MCTHTASPAWPSTWRDRYSCDSIVLKWRESTTEYPLKWTANTVWMVAQFIYFSAIRFWFLLCRKKRRRSWKCQQKCSIWEAQQQQSKLHSRAAGWLLQLACRAEFLNDTSVITPAVLAGQLHPDMLYLVDFTGKQSAAMFGALHHRVWQNLVVLRWKKVLKYSIQRRGPCNMYALFINQWDIQVTCYWTISCYFFEPALCRLATS